MATSIAPLLQEGAAVDLEHFQLRLELRVSNEVSMGRWLPEERFAVETAPF